MEVLDDRKRYRQCAQGCSRLTLRFLFLHAAVSEIADAFDKGVRWRSAVQQGFPQRMIESMPFLLHADQVAREGNNPCAVRRFQVVD